MRKNNLQVLKQQTVLYMQNTKFMSLPILLATVIFLH